ncbi:MAG TPA: BatA domain-containing protein, partial [Tenuifilum sp.]|nr:BatA domain-containing protein [Tenuifilum sp.]HRU85863.1 BatA domain-containing protein [Tenuifilum sp.]
MLLVVYANPKFLYLLLLIPSLVGWYIYRLHKSRAALVISTAKHFDNTGKSVKVYLRHLPFALRMLALALAIIALARPQSTNIQRNVTTEGIDIVLSLDVSGSMLARDFKPDRLEAAKSLG